MYKTIILLILALSFVYDTVLSILSINQRKKPLPMTVADIYGKTEYEKWQRYSAEKSRLGIIESAVNLVVYGTMFSTDVFAALYSVLPGGEYVKSILLFVIFTLVIFAVSVPFDAIRQLKIEEKYGFNRATKGTFAADEIKDLAVDLILNIGLLLLCICMYHLFGVKFVYVTFAVLAVFIIVFSTLSSTFQKLYNKFTPLEEGELRDMLTELFRRSGYELDDILVMDASKRTTKANAYCTGLGRFKKIVLYDNLISACTPREITAVFAHELGHYKHRDTVKLTAYSILMMAAVTALIAAFVAFPEISTDFGFDGVSVVFALIAITAVIMEPVMAVLNVPLCILSRRFEHRADLFAAKCGYGTELVTALKKLMRDSLSDLNPHPLIVFLEHNHPTLEQRIMTLSDEKSVGREENDI